MSVSNKATENILRSKGFRFVGLILLSLIIDSYLRRPPPRPPPPPRDPMLEAPRELLARALPPLIPPEPPPKAPPPLEEPPEPDETLRLPTRSPPPPPPRFDPKPLAPSDPRLPAPDCRPPPRSMLPACAPCPRPPSCPWFWRALAWRLPMESPRAVPPYLLAVALLE